MVKDEYIFETVYMMHSDDSESKDLIKKSPDKSDYISDNPGVTFIVGQRGRPKLIYNGYSYFCAKTLHDKKYWVCSKQRSRKCKGRLITTSEAVELRNFAHSHPQEYYKDESE